MNKQASPALALRSSELRFEDDDMTNERDAKAVDRRNFLKTLRAGAGATTLAAAGAATGAAIGAIVAPGTADAAESAADKTKKRYQETDHVKTYYRTNRY